MPYSGEDATEDVRVSSCFLTAPFGTACSVGQYIVQPVPNQETQLSLEGVTTRIQVATIGNKSFWTNEMGCSKGCLAQCTTVALQYD